jgi:hypothetical protein
MGNQDYPVYSKRNRENQAYAILCAHVIRSSEPDKRVMK